LDNAHKHRFSGTVEGIYHWHSERRPMHQLEVREIFDVSDNVVEKKWLELAADFSSP